MKTKRLLCAALASVFFSPSFSAMNEPEIDQGPVLVKPRVHYRSERPDDSQSSPFLKFLPYGIVALAFGTGGFLLGRCSKSEEALSPEKYENKARAEISKLCNSYVDSKGSLDLRKIDDGIIEAGAYFLQAAKACTTASEKVKDKKDYYLMMQRIYMAYANQCALIRLCLLNPNEENNYLFAEPKLKTAYDSWMVYDFKSSVPTGWVGYAMGKQRELRTMVFYFDNHCQLDGSPSSYWSSFKAPGTSNSQKCFVRSKVTSWLLLNRIASYDYLNSGTMAPILNNINECISAYRKENNQERAKEMESIKKYINFITSSQSAQGEQEKIRANYQGKFLYYLFTLFM